jgi:hypothetical protein
MKKMLVVTLLIPLLFGCVKEGVEEAEEIAEEIIETTEETVEVIEEEVVQNQKEPENIIEESVETPIDTAINTSDWKTYRNDKYGYSFKYDPINSGKIAGTDSSYPLLTRSENLTGLHEGKFRVETQDIELFPKESFGYMILDLEDFAKHMWDLSKKYSTKRYGKNEISNLTETTISGQPAYQFTLTGRFIKQTGTFVTDEEYLFTITNNGTYNFIIWFPSNNSYLRETFNSFRFEEIAPQFKKVPFFIKGIPLESDVDTSNWQAYRNEEYGFEMKYPKNWYISHESNKGGHFSVSFGNNEFGTYDCRFDCPDDFQIFHLNIYPDEIEYRCGFEIGESCTSTADTIYKHEVGKDLKMIIYERITESKTADITLPKAHAYLVDGENHYHIFSSGHYSSENSLEAMTILKNSLFTFKFTD